MSWYNAKSEEELTAQSILTVGKGKYKVFSSRMCESASGNQQLELVLDVTDSSGKTKRIWDYLVAHPDFEWKIRHFAYSCGLERQYEDGQLTDKSCPGKYGACEIAHQTTKKGQYAGQVRAVIKDYTAREKESGGFFDDDVPLNTSDAQTPPSWATEEANNAPI